MRPTNDKLLILRLSALGDVIHTLPAVEMLRAGNPRASLCWVVERPYEQLVKLAAPVDEVIVAATRRWRRAPFSEQTRSEIREILRRVRQSGAGGVVVDFQGLAKSAILGRLSGRASQITFPAGVVRERPARWLATADAPVDVSAHVVDQNRQLARAAGGKGEGGFSGLKRFVSEGREDDTGLLDRIVINPGAGQPGKIWEPARWAELGRRLARDGRRPLVVWGPGEEELAQSIAGEGGELAPATSLPRLGYILSRARLVVSGDTGPLHLAAGLGAPVLALFGPTDPRRNGPYGQLERCISGNGSMGGISVDEVAARAFDLLAQDREADRAK